MTGEVNTGLHRKQTINVLFNEVPERVIKNLDLFTNKAEFLERLKLKDDAMPDILDLMVHDTRVSNCFHYMINIALFGITYNLICTEYLCVFYLKLSSVHLGRLSSIHNCCVMLSASYAK